MIKLEQTHKHKGVERSDGSLRSHPISRTHKDPKVKRWHNLALANQARKNKNSSSKKVEKETKPKKETKVEPVQTKEQIFPQKQTVLVPVDDDGYLRVDLTQTNHKGLRVKFQRVEGRKRRIVGVEINK